MLTNKAKPLQFFRIVSQQQNDSITIEIINEQILFDITLHEILKCDDFLNGFSATDKKIIYAMAEAINISIE
jgi:hypothetical protein